MKHHFKRELDSYRAKQREFRIIEVPPRQYLMVDGHGDPNTAPAFADAVAALYPVAYKLKSASKALGRDYTVMPLEGLWWSDDHSVFTSARDKSLWDWTLMIMVLPWTTRAMFDDAREDRASVRLATLHDEFIPEHRLRMRGKHHEVYLSDARRVEPERRRTILRQPVSH